jgi:uncharacterized protein YyaL (SSP411 family)
MPEGTGSNRLADSTSPYLRSHAGNPVDWWPWSEEAFAEAARRDVPVLISIGYATCHWCHVMARESFSDPAIAAQLAAGFVAIKVDREEHPEVDAAYLAAASAFTPSLGWPLTVFTTPAGATFYACTYFPPRAVQGVPAFTEVLDAITEAWAERRDDVEQTAASLVAALTAEQPGGGDLPALEDFAGAVDALAALEDPQFGGFGDAPKFPTTPVLTFLLEHGSPRARDLAVRTLAAMAASPLRDPVEGGFFRYAVHRDWSDPHYERMLTDNAQLLGCYAAIGDAATATGIAGFLLDVLRVPGGFASGQDSESVIDGVRVEGGYYARDADARAALAPPPLDAKVLTGLNGLAIGALADAAVRFDRPEWITAASEVADAVLALHGDSPPLRRASLDGRASDAVATLEDYGGLAGGLLRLALAAGQPRYAEIARRLIEACEVPDGGVAAPGGSDSVLTARGLALPPEISDGATPAGPALLADAALLLAALTGDDRHTRLAERAIAPALAAALTQPISFGAALAIGVRLARPVTQLVIVGDAQSPLAGVARAWGGPARVFAIVPERVAREFASAGFELFAGRDSRAAEATAYLCERFVCELPLSDPARLADRLAV